MANVNDVSNYKVIFSANEYTYSINLMDNSTELSAFKKSKPDVPHTTTKRVTTTSTTSKEIETTTSSTITKSSFTSSSRPIDEELVETRESYTIYPESLLKIDEISEKNDFYDAADYNPNQESEKYSNENREEDRYLEYSTELEGIKYSSRYEKDEDLVYTSLSSTKSTTGPISSYTSTTPTVNTIKSTHKLLNEDSKSHSSNILKITSNSDDMESSKEKFELSQTNQVQNFRAVFKNNLRRLDESESLTSSASPSSYNLLRSSPQLNLALYIVISLLCFSLIINITLLYITKIKQNRNKLIISHKICEKIVTTPSQRSASSIKSSQLVDCNINLINSSNDSATSYVDPDQ
jgi:hypothetical protein